MAMTKGRPVEADYSHDAPASFPVFVRRAIGEVRLDGSGQLHPHEAAFVLIAQEGEDGSYEFPMPDGGTCCVEVYHRKPGQD